MVSDKRYRMKAWNIHRMQRLGLYDPVKGFNFHEMETRFKIGFQTSRRGHVFHDLVHGNTPLDWREGYRDYLVDCLNNQKSQGYIYMARLLDAMRNFGRYYTAILVCENDYQAHMLKTFIESEGAELP